MKLNEKRVVFMSQASFYPCLQQNRQSCLAVNKQFGQAHLKSKPGSVDSEQVHVCLSRA